MTPTCFIIMPITTPESQKASYGNDEDHFKHVFDCLVVPSVKQAGFEPIPPSAEGSDIIQGRIIKNLETADWSSPVIVDTAFRLLVLYE